MQAANLILLFGKWVSHGLATGYQPGLRRLSFLHWTHLAALLRSVAHEWGSASTRCVLSLDLFFLLMSTPHRLSCRSFVTRLELRTWAPPSIFLLLLLKVLLFLSRSFAITMNFITLQQSSMRKRSSGGSHGQCTASRDQFRKSCHLTNVRILTRSQDTHLSVFDSVLPLYCVGLAHLLSDLFLKTSSFHII